MPCSPAGPPTLTPTARPESGERLERPRNGGRSDGAAAPRSARKTRRERGWACRTIALSPVLAVGDGLASAAPQGTGAARLGAPAIFRPATIPRSLLLLHSPQGRLQQRSELHGLPGRLLLGGQRRDRGHRVVGLARRPAEAGQRLQ